MIQFPGFAHVYACFHIVTECAVRQTTTGRLVKTRFSYKKPFSHHEHSCRTACYIHRISTHQHPAEQQDRRTNWLLFCSTWTWELSDAALMWLGDYYKDNSWSMEGVKTEYGRDKSPTHSKTGRLAEANHNSSQQPLCMAVQWLLQCVWSQVISVFFNIDKDMQHKDAHTHTNTYMMRFVWCVLRCNRQIPNSIVWSIKCSFTRRHWQSELTKKKLNVFPKI